VSFFSGQEFARRANQLAVCSAEEGKEFSLQAPRFSGKSAVLLSEICTARDELQRLQNIVLPTLVSGKTLWRRKSLGEEEQDYEED
jgi:hypothetical protein